MWEIHESILNNLRTVLLFTTIKCFIYYNLNLAKMQLQTAAITTTSKFILRT